jgi:hypothetical protein
MTNRERIINNYIEAYNRFDVNRMITDFDDDMVFENIQNGELNLYLTGLAAFKEQAEQAKAYFSKRTQTITSFLHRSNETEIEINYHAVLGMDFPNGLKSGQELNLHGKSVFCFVEDRITKLTDIS